MDAFPSFRGKMEYVCQECNARFPGDNLFYTCPKCGGVFLLIDKNFDELKKTSGQAWREIFDARQMTSLQSLRGIFRFYELMAPTFTAEDIIYLGEGNTPIIPAAERLQKEIGAAFAFKNEGQNPSASFKDRGMAMAFTCIKWLSRLYGWKEVLTICASTGDTSAAAALYAAYVGPPVKSVVLLPLGKVTPQQLAQPLGSGATVICIPGVFDDCMRVVEILAEHYRVALLNSKNSWRILGQESYAYEVAQWRGWQLENTALFIPIGNAGNITALLSGLLKLFKLEIITKLPRIFGVQSVNANPVYNYYHSQEKVWKPVKVKPSVAQAAMIGNPVSFPRVRKLVEKYTAIAGANSFNVMEVSEEEIMEAMLVANRHGHISCTQGGECFAALIKAVSQKTLTQSEYAILDSTAHMLKFSDFQNRYFENSLVEDYDIHARPELVNKPIAIMSNEERDNTPYEYFTKSVVEKITDILSLTPKS